MKSELKKSVNTVIFVVFLIYMLRMAAVFLLPKQSWSIKEYFCSFFGSLNIALLIISIFLMLISLVYKTYIEKQCFIQITYYSTIICVLSVLFSIDFKAVLANIVLVLPFLIFSIITLYLNRKNNKKYKPKTVDKYKRVVNVVVYVLFVIYTYRVSMALLSFTPSNPMASEMERWAEYSEYFLMHPYSEQFPTNLLLLLIYLILMTVSLKYKTYTEKQYFIKITIYSIIVMVLSLVGTNGALYLLETILFVLPQLIFSVIVLIKQKKRGGSMKGIHNGDNPSGFIGN